MSWVLVLIAVWVVVALAVALVIGRSIHLADLKRQAALDRHLTFGGPDLAREGSESPRFADSADDGRDVIWRDVAAGEAPRTAPRRGRSAVGGHGPTAKRATRDGERRRA
ncbi:hypothetical protein E9549_13735 [Blastococcus sp. MG754426]|uniref:hypothetical protein n=1 Tax=unclassified Blastococcus TaxID=2619396 RepID=UPI001EF0FCB6|nr:MULTISPECIES: hypothetical protein [unclassified Blastococcus]MCF6508460.1 hypothetical protein [Blastococcus sp. MG754426]MCF6513461.1 hypothetical protein [Blastococcus sp. MG754427]